MADVNLTPQTIGIAGATPTYTALNATDTYVVPLTTRTLLHFKNTNAGIATVTFQTPGNVAGLAIADPTLAVPATTGDKMVATLPSAVYRGTDGALRFTQNVATGCTVAVVQMVED